MQRTLETKKTNNNSLVWGFSKIRTHLLRHQNVDIYLENHLHRMKIFLSVNWNISQCPMIAHGMFTEIRISGIVHVVIFQWSLSPTECCWMTGTFQLPNRNFFLNFHEKKFKIFYQIRGFKVILLWNLTKVRHLFTPWHRGSDKSPLLIVFKWNFYELCLWLFHNDFDKSDSVLTKSFSLLSVALHFDFHQSDSVL